MTRISSLFATVLGISSVADCRIFPSSHNVRQVVVPPTNYYYGCYTEAVNARALANSASASANMTVESCAAFCRSRGQTLFGVEYMSECYCGTSLSRGAVRASESDCGMACSGNGNETCGGSNRLSLWGTQAPPPLPLAFKFYNCYVQPPSTLALSGAQLQNAVNMTVETCASYCLNSQNSTYFGLTNGSTCMCGSNNPLPAGVQPTASPSACNTTCPGNAADVCGGPSQVSLFGALDDAPAVAVADYTYTGCYTEGNNTRALTRGKKLCLLTTLLSLGLLTRLQTFNPLLL
jgi:hypothetical protein